MDKKLFMLKLYEGSFTYTEGEHIWDVVEAARALARTRNSTITEANRHEWFLGMCEAVEALERAEEEE
jgi:hypothetical protein